MKLKFVAFSILGISAVFSCTKSDLTSPKEAEIIVQAGVAQTRAGYDEDILPESFVMDILQNSDSDYDYKSVLMNKDGDRYVPNLNRMVWAGTQYSSVDVKAMTIPFGMSAADVNDQNTLVVTVSQDQNYEANLLASDLLVANDGDITVYDSKININFKHLMSKLEIKCVYGSTLNSGNVTIHSVALKNVCVSGGYSYADMSIQPDYMPQAGDISMLVDESGENPVFEAIFFPYVPSENPVLEVVATVENEMRTLNCRIAPKTEVGFVSGRRYTMTVTINGAAIAPSSISIDSEWGVGNEDDDFNLDFGADMEMGEDVFITD